MSDIVTLLNQLWELVLNFKLLDDHTKITSITLFLVAVWKSSVFKPTWDKLAAWKFVVPGVLGLAIGYAAMPTFSWELAWESVRSGLLAIALHKITLGLKEIPGIGPKYQKAIAWIESLLRKPVQDAADKGIKDPIG